MQLIKQTPFSPLMAAKNKHPDSVPLIAEVDLSSINQPGRRAMPAARRGERLRAGPGAQTPACGFRGFWGVLLLLIPRGGRSWPRPPHSPARPYGGFSLAHFRVGAAVSAGGGSARPLPRAGRPQVPAPPDATPRRAAPLPLCLIR